MLTIFWTGNVSLNNGTSDTKTIYDLTNTILSEADRVTALNNIEAILNSHRKNKKCPIQHKSSCVLASLFTKTFFYDNKNMVAETYVTEMNRNISLYRVFHFWENKPIYRTNYI